MRGRPKGSGLSTRKQKLYGHREHRVVQLRAAVLAAEREQKDKRTSKLAHNHFSALLADYNARAAAHVQERRAIFKNEHRPDNRLQRLREMKNKMPVMTAELAAYRDWKADCDVALIESDANFFLRQAEAIEWAKKHAQDWPNDHSQFANEIFRLLGMDLFHIDKPEARWILDECFKYRVDAEPLTENDKQTIRKLERTWIRNKVEEIIGKSYKPTKSGDYVPVSKGGHPLIVEWTIGKRRGKQRYSCRFKNERCALDAIRDIIKLARPGNQRAQLILRVAPKQAGRPPDYSRNLRPLVRAERERKQ